MSEKNYSPEHLSMCMKFHVVNSFGVGNRWRRPEDVPYKTFLRENRKPFEKLSEILGKYRIDPDDFIEFVVVVCGVRVPKDALKREIFEKYGDHVGVREQYGKIRGYFMRSVKNISESCVELGQEPEEYLNGLITGNKLGYYLISGKISKYFIGSFSNFKKLYGKMDYLNRSELSIIYNASDEIFNSVQSAFLYETGKRVNPIQMVKEEINRKKKEQKNVHVSQ
jgi:hypothetical protein